LEILAFPCNQFGHQEPGSDEDIKQFAREEKHATFNIMAKTDVNGQTASLLFKTLRDVTMHGEPIAWNFAKFLCNGDGMPVRGYPPKMDPLRIENDIIALLK